MAINRFQHNNFLRLNHPHTVNTIANRELRKSETLIESTSKVKSITFCDYQSSINLMDAINPSSMTICTADNQEPSPEHDESTELITRTAANRIEEWRTPNKIELPRNYTLPKRKPCKESHGKIWHPAIWSGEKKLLIP